jgi:hypothetical protein
MHVVKKNKGQPAMSLPTFVEQVYEYMYADSFAE